MSVTDLEGSIDTITTDLKNMEERREKLIKGTRDIILLCSKSIVALHNGKYESSLQQTGKAKELLDELRHTAKEDLYRYLISAETELVEANTLQAIISTSNIPSMQILNVQGNSYIFGLLDCVGELKRLVFDKNITVDDNDVIKLGNLNIKVIYTPGHSKDGICLFVENKLFCGDTLFVGSCGRIDLPGGNTSELYDSLFDILIKLDDDIEIYPGHDYGNKPVSTIGDEKKNNPILKPRTKEEFLFLMG